MVDGLSRVTDSTQRQENKEAKRRDILSNRAIMRARRAILEAPFKAWSGYLNTEKLHKKRSAKFSKRLFMRDVGRAFNSWLASRFGSSSSVDPSTLKSYMQRMKSQGLVKAMNTWSGQMKRTNELKAVVRRMKQVPVVKALNRWLEVAKARWARADQLKGVLTTLSPEGRAKRQAFNSWKPLAMAAKRIRHALRTIMMRKERLVFTTWLENAMERAEALYEVKRAVQAMAQRGLRMGFNSWLEFCGKVAADQRRLKSAAGALRGDGVSKAWFTWCEMNAQMNEMRRAVQRLMNQRAARGFEKWCAFAKKPVASGGERILASWRGDGRVKRMALNSWVEHVQQRNKLRQAAMSIAKRPQYLAFSTWAEVVLGKQKRLAALGRSVASLKNRPLKMAMNAWMEFATQAAEAKRRLTSAAASFRGDKTRMCWNTWAAAVEEIHNMRRALSSFTNQAQFRAFESWRSYAEESAGAKSKASGVLKSLTPEGRAMRKVFNSWSESAAAVANMRRAVSALVNKELRMGWNTFVEYAAEQAARIAAMQKAVQGMRQRGLRAAMNGWIEQAALLAEGKRKLKAAAGAFKGDGVLKAWLTWKDSASSQHAMKRAILALTNRVQRQGFNSWAQNAAELAEKKHAMEKALTAMSSQGLVKGFNGWVEFAEDAAESRRKLKGAVTSMIQKGLRQGYNTWEAMWVQLSSMKRAAAFLVNGGLARGMSAWMEEAQRLREQKEQREAGMKRAISAIVNRGQRAAFNTWNDYASKAAESKRRLLAGASAFKGDKTRAVWNSWCEHVQSVHDMRMAVSRFVNQNQSRAFESWREYAEQAAAAAAKLKGCLTSLSPEGRAMRKALNSWQEMAADVANMRRAISALVNKELRLGFNAWSEAAAEQAAKLLAMQRAVAGMRQAGLLKAFNGLSEYAIESAEAKRRLQSAASAFRGDGLRAAWNQWTSAAAEGERQQRLAKRAGARLAHAPLAKAYGAWVAMAEERARQMEIARRTAAFFGPMGRAWNQWCSLMPAWYRMRKFGKRLMKRGLLQAWLQWLDAAEQNARLRALGQRALNSDLVFAWMKWGEMMSDQQKMGKFMKRLTNRGMAKCFDTWLALIDEIERQKRKMGPILRRLMSRGLTSAMNKWLDVAAEGRKMRAIGRRMLNRGVSNALNKWNEFAYEKARMERLMKRVVRKVMSRVLVATFDAWANCVLESKEEREEKQRRMLNMMRNKELATTFYAWVSFVEEATAKKQKYLLRWANMLIAKVLLAWAKWAKNEVRLRGLMKSIAIRIARRTEVIVLQEWHRYVMEAHAAMRRALKLWENVGMGRCYRKLQEHAEEQLRLKRLASKLLAGVLYGLQMRVFNGWLNEVQLIKRQFEAAAKFYGRYQNQLATKCFLAWAGDVQRERETREQRILHSLQRMRYGSMSIVWDQWRQLVEVARAERAEAEAAAAAAARGEGDGGGLSYAESAALKAEVATLRRELARTRKELKEVAFSSARRYELAIVRAELLSRNDGAANATTQGMVEGGIEDVENDPFAPTMHGHLWKYAAPFLPEPQEQVLLERITHNAQPPKPPSSFLQKLSEQAPLTFPAAPSPPPQTQPKLTPQNKPPPREAHPDRSSVATDAARPPRAANLMDTNAPHLAPPQKMQMTSRAGQREIVTTASGAVVPITTTMSARPASPIPPPPPPPPPPLPSFGQPTPFPAAAPKPPQVQRPASASPRSMKPGPTIQQRMAAFGGGAGGKASTGEQQGLQRVKSKEEMTTQAVQRNLQHHAERLGLKQAGAALGALEARRETQVASGRVAVFDS